jgi:ribose 5-phosphate isomerase B
MRIAIAADHNGVAKKARLTAWLTAHGHTVDDRGAEPRDGEVDYPRLCAEVCRLVREGAADRGIVLGGSGLGETVACNRFHGIRAGLCRDVWSARISRGNNDANVLVLAAKVTGFRTLRRITAAWLSTGFKGGVHERRLTQIARIEAAEAARCVEGVEAARHSDPRE